MDVTTNSHRNMATAKSSPDAETSPDKALGTRFSKVDYFPGDIVKRQTATWHGMQVETVQLTRRKPFEYRFRKQYHLLIAAEQGARYEGETLVEGLPRSTLREFSRKLTFIPAGRSFFGSQDPRLLARSTYFHIDPGALPVDPELGFADADLEPRLFFEAGDLWQTALKLKDLVGDPDGNMRLYADALSAVLAHELMQLNSPRPPTKQESRGGLAPWQQKRVANFIEEHLAENVSLAALSGLVRLSPYHFLRSFKRSFGQPPHRYHTTRRIEQAKVLLAGPRASVTEAALHVGFSTTSAFSAAFHRVTGHTPTEYRRNLE